MKRLLVLLCLTLSCLGFSQDHQWSIAYNYRVTGSLDDRASAGALTKITSLTNVFGKGWSLDLDAYAGFTLRKAAPVAAFMVGTRRQVADQASIYFGVGPIVSQGQPTAFSASFGINLRF